MTEAYAIANDALRARAEAAESECHSLRTALQCSNDNVAEAKGRLADALARAEAAKNERDQAIDYLYALGRHYGRPRAADETVESWASRVTKAIHANQEPSEVSVQLREELDQLQGVNDRLKAEGLAAIERAKAAERQHVDAAARAEAAEKERGALRARLSFAENPDLSEVAILRVQLDAVTAERDQATIARDDADANMRDWKRAYDGVCAKLTDAKCRIADLEAAPRARTFTSLVEQTGPVAFERNQLRDELAELRPQLDELRAKLAAAEHRAAMHERDADEASRAVATLETMFCAAIRAVARGAK